MRLKTKKAGWFAAALLLAAVLFWGREWIWLGAGQLFRGAAAALAALPFARRLEKRLPPGASAALALGAAGMLAAAVVLLAVPPLVSQLRLFADMLPHLLETAGEMLGRGRIWLSQHGLPVDETLQTLMTDRSRALFSEAAPAVAGWVGGLAGGIGKWMLTPVFAFYLLRDRRQIAQKGLQLLSPRYRRLIRRMCSEMRREVTGYLRGELLICAAVGGLTAAALLLCGVEAWFVLGLVMGVLELVPYAGPFLGGFLAVLFALPGGMGRVLWTLAAVIAVQQAEGSVLSPRLLSFTTQLHPLTVMLAVTLGGAAGGVSGMLLAVPLLLCARAVLRVAAEERRWILLHR